MKHVGMKRAFFAACLLSAWVSAFALPITFSDVTIIRETRSAFTPPGFSTGDNFLLSLDATPASDTTVTATNSNSLDTYSLSLFGGSNFSSDFITYSDSLANGEWIFTAENGVDITTSGSFVFGTGDGTGPMPGVTGLTVSGPSTTPTLEWDLLDLKDPDGNDINDGYVNRLRTRVQDKFGNIIFDSRSDEGESLALTLTSYDIPEGYITEPGEYFAQVLVEGFGPKELGEPGDNFDLDVAFTQLVRSRTFAEGFTVTVPEPSIIALFAAGLFGIGFARRRTYN